VKTEFLQKLYSNHLKASECPSPSLVVKTFKKILNVLYPEFSDNTFENFEEFERYYESIKFDIKSLLVSNTCDSSDPELTTSLIFDVLPDIKENLDHDVNAIYNGDPAAKSLTEVVRTYPGFYAIAAYRIAHEFHKHKLSLIPRIISEHAHSKTGIDIHPGAIIGKHFCIDHGTGVVIGETTEIGNHVKIYQGVTLGALSVKKEDAKTKRHPTIEDHVVIYSGATILGGKTVVGHNSIIGGNVWIVESVPPKSRLIYLEARRKKQITESNNL
jgi:serine O-acetyltransferase